MREDLPPGPRAMLSFIGTALSILGVLIQLVSFLLVLLIGLACAFIEVTPLGILLALLIFMVVQAFGSVMLEFGLVITRGRLPVRPEKILGWWSSRFAMIWSAALVIPLTLATIVRLCRLEWTALAAGVLAVGSVWATRYFYRLAEKLI